MPWCSAFIPTSNGVRLGALPSSGWTVGLAGHPRTRTRHRVRPPGSLSLVALRMRPRLRDAMGMPPDPPPAKREAPRRPGRKRKQDRPSAQRQSPADELSQRRKGLVGHFLPGNLGYGIEMNSLKLLRRANGWNAAAVPDGEDGADAVPELDEECTPTKSLDVRSLPSFDWEERIRQVEPAAGAAIDAAIAARSSVPPQLSRGVPIGMLGSEEEANDGDEGELDAAAASGRFGDGEHLPVWNGLPADTFEENETDKRARAVRNKRSTAARARWADPLYKTRVLEARRRTLNRRRRVALAMELCETRRHLEMQPEPSTESASLNGNGTVGGDDDQHSKTAARTPRLRSCHEVGPLDSVALSSEERSQQLIAYARANALRSARLQEMWADRATWMRKRLEAGAVERQRRTDPERQAVMQARRSEAARRRHAQRRAKEAMQSADAETPTPVSESS